MVTFSTWTLQVSSGVSASEARGVFLLRSGVGRPQHYLLPATSHAGPGFCSPTWTGIGMTDGERRNPRRRQFISQANLESIGEVGKPSSQLSPAGRAAAKHPPCTAVEIQLQLNEE